MTGGFTGLPCCALLAACSTGYSQGEMERELAAAKLSYVSRDLSIEEIDQLKPQVPLPARIAIAPQAHALTIADGVLLDNRNEYLCALADTQAVIAESRVEALRSFGRAFIAQGVSCASRTLSD
jgi:hypothetical protein